REPVDDRPEDPGEVTHVDDSAWPREPVGAAAPPRRPDGGRDRVEHVAVRGADGRARPVAAESLRRRLTDSPLPFADQDVVCSCCRVADGDKWASTTTESSCPAPSVRPPAKRSRTPRS